MNRILMIITIYCITFNMTVKTIYAEANQETDELHHKLVLMFEYAKAHNVQAIEKMKIGVERLNSTTLLQGFYVALYLADPNTYETEYVKQFPTDLHGIMYDLYENIELKRLTPTFLYSMKAIGEIALKGNERAIEKVFIGDMNSDGVVGEMFCDYTAKLFNKTLQKTLTVLSKKESSNRNEVYKCFALMSKEEISLLGKKIENIKSDNKNIKQLVEEISLNLSR